MKHATCAFFVHTLMMILIDYTQLTDLGLHAQPMPWIPRELDRGCDAFQSNLSNIFVSTPTSPNFANWFCTCSRFLPPHRAQRTNRTSTWCCHVPPSPQFPHGLSTGSNVISSAKVQSMTAYEWLLENLMELTVARCITPVDRPVRSKSMMFQSTTLSSIKLVPATLCCDAKSIITRISGRVLLAWMSSEEGPRKSLTVLYKLSSALPLTDIVVANSGTSDERKACTSWITHLSALNKVKHVLEPPKKTLKQRLCKKGLMPQKCVLWPVRPTSN
jgi:hypothetical protein